MRRLALVPIIIGALLVIIFLLAGTPFILALVKEKTETAVSQSMGVPLVIGRLRGNLFYAVELEDIDFASTIQIERLRIRYSPFRLLAKQVEITYVQVSGLHVNFDRFEELLKKFPTKTAETESQAKAETRAFGVTIREFSIRDSGLFGTVGNTSLTASLATGGSLVREQVKLDSLCFVTEKSQVTISGNIPLNEQHDISLDFDMAVAAEELGMPGFGGEIQGHGSVSGKFSAIALQGIIQLDILYFENSLSGDVALEWLIPNFGDLSVEARLRAMTVPLRKDSNQQDHWDLSLQIKDTNLDCDIGSNLGDMRLRGTLREDFTQPYFKGTIEGRFDYADFEPSFSGRVHYRNDTLELNGFRLLSRRVAADLALLLSTDTKRIHKAQVELVCSDLSVLDDFLSSPQKISGKLRSKLHASGTLDNPRVYAAVSVSDVVIYGEKAAAARFDLSLRNSIARLDSGFVESERGKITLQGSCDLQSLDFTANLYSEGIVFEAPEVFGTTTLLLSGTVGLDLRSSGNIHAPMCEGKIVIDNFAYDTLQFGDYHLQFRLADDSLQLSLKRETEDLILDAGLVLRGAFPITAHLDLKHLVLDRFVTPAAGYVTGSISADGELANLQGVRAALQIDTVSFLIEQKPIENVGEVIARLDAGVVDIRACELAVAGQRLSLQGRMPLDVGASAMEFSVSSSEIQLSDVSYLLPEDPMISGTLKLDLHIGGQLKTWDIDGQLSLSNGRYDVDNIRIDSVGAFFRFKNGMITIDRFSGKVNKGRFEISGHADLSRGLLDSMLLAIKFKYVNYSSKEFGSMVSSADFQVSARMDSVRIDGEVLIHEAVYDKPMRLQTMIGLLTTVNRPVPQQPEIFRRVYCNVGITAPDRIKIANNIAKLNVKADLQLKGYLARLNAYGTIAAIDEGTVQYLGKKFKIVNAVIQFDDPYKIDPVIDLSATSTINAADGAYEISMHLSGTATTWQLELNSNPPLPEQDIVSLLLIGQRRPGAVGGMAKDVDLKGRVKDYALDMIRHSIEKTTADVLGLDKFTITGDLTDPAAMRIGVEKSIIEGFKLHYTTGVESWELQQIGASYDLTERVSIFTLYDQENRNTSVDLELHFKLK